MTCAPTGWTKRSVATALQALLLEDVYASVVDSMGWAMPMLWREGRGSVSFLKGGGDIKGLFDYTHGGYSAIEDTQCTRLFDFT